MNEAVDAQAIYIQGYAALEAGDFSAAISLASRCMVIASPDSYWRYGALGLRCWSANFLGESEQVEHDAGALLHADAGPQSEWFQGLAWLNLGLMRRRRGNGPEAARCFREAESRYENYHPAPDVPEAWRAIHRFFVAVSHWAACGDLGALEALGSELARTETPDEEIADLVRAIDLYRRRARGEWVREEAARAVESGVSRTFLALLLLEEGPDA